MAGEAERDFLAAQAASVQAFNTNGGVINGGADNSDSDDYEPSATLQEDYPMPYDVSEKITTPVSVARASEDNSLSHALSSLPQSRPSSAVAVQGPPNMTHISSKAPPQNQPRIKGGFVVDEEDESDDEDDEDAKDVLDVYGSVDGTEVENITTAPNLQIPFDSSITSDVPIHRAAQSSEKPSNVSISASAVVASPSTLQSSGVSSQHASTPTPIQTLSVNQAKAVPGSSSVTATHIATVPKARLAHDTVGILEDRIKEDPRGDMAAWLELISELQNRNKRDEVRRAYERFFKVFPLAAEQWAAYCTWEEENNNLYQLEQLFNRSLLAVPNVQLWSIYVNYIRRRNSMTTGDTAKSYKIISDSFTFALNNVGMDKDSGRLWQEYVDFIKAGPGLVGGSGWQDTQKMDALRAAYQKAICVPTSALYQLWKEYDSFETGLSKINGRKFLQEKSPAYMTARSCYTQLQNMTKELVRTTLPKLPPAPGFYGDAEYVRQVDLWKEWIQWEKEDNLVLRDEDYKAFRDRVLFAYNQSLMALQFWPEMWYDAAEFCFGNGLEKEGTEFLVRGIATNPESCLLAFKLADRLELTTTSDEASDPGAKTRMKKVREPFDTVLDALYDLIAKARTREAQDIARIESTLKNSNFHSQSGGRRDEEDEEYNLAEIEAQKVAMQTQIEAVKRGVAVQVGLLQKTISYAWVALMRAARRIQGKGMPGERGGGFRVIFGDARKKGKITSDVYVESALIEYHCYKDPAGTKIFERGMKLFPEDENFALEYLKHLIAINDITNARAVFETTVGRLTSNPTTAARAKPIFIFLHEYEAHFGELSQVARLEKRMSDLYPEDLGLNHFASRFVSPTFDPTSIRPIVSSQQVKSKDLIHSSVEAPPSAQNTPPARLSDTIATNSPKRPFPMDDFEDVQPRKQARGESPLKGAAGRRMNQQQRQNLNGGFPSSTMSQVHPPPPPPLPGQVGFLLSIIPKASTYVDARFDPVKMVELLRDVRLPPSAPSRPHEQAPNWPTQFQHQHQQQPMMHPGMMPGGPMMNQQFGGAYRYG